MTVNITLDRKDYGTGLATHLEQIHRTPNRRKEIKMQWDQLEGRWDQVKGSLTAKWSHFTQEDLRAIDGKRDTLIKKLRERYGLLKHQAARQADEWAAGQDA
jgi:uncharacterized protein YjbJ (UPF0337 family)